MPKHLYSGEATGRINQQAGKHCQYSSNKSIGLIPLGDRHRVSDVTDRTVYYFTGVLEERDSSDGYEKFLK